MLDRLSAIDRLFVQALYDPRISVGTHARDVMPLITEILLEYDNRKSD